MVSGMKDGGYLLESYPHKYFGKASVVFGKSCMRFRKLMDLDVERVEELIGEAARGDISPIAV